MVSAILKAPTMRAMRRSSAEPHGDAGSSHADGGSDGAADLIAAYDALVCDLDGVVYRGDGAVPGAPEVLREVAARGVRLIYATNNASRVPADVAAHLRRLGAPARDGDVVTSAEAGAGLLADRLPAGAPVLALGGDGVASALEQAGLRPVMPSAATSAPDVAAVLQGLGRQLTVADFETAAQLIEQGAVWVATNADTTLPMEWGTAPGNGAYLDLLASATGRRPEASVGKPASPLYDLAVARGRTSPRRTLAVGDRLDTDIAGARAAGLDSAWVLTGVDAPSDLLTTDLIPTFVLGSLAELLQPYAVPRRHEGSWHCASATARLVDGILNLDPGDRGEMDAVRAGLAALIEHRDGPDPSPELLRKGGATLDRLWSRSVGTDRATRYR